MKHRIPVKTASRNKPSAVVVSLAYNLLPLTPVSDDVHTLCTLTTGRGRVKGSDESSVDDDIGGEDSGEEVCPCYCPGKLGDEFQYCGKSDTKNRIRSIQREERWNWSRRTGGFTCAIEVERSGDEAGE